MSKSSSSSSSASDSDSSIDYDKYNLNINGEYINNRYLVIRELGRGACSIVWMIYDMEDKDFYAMKVHNYDEYDDAKDEISFSGRLPRSLLFNKVLTSFVIIREKKKYVCSVSNICAGNLDCFIRKGYYSDGFDTKVVEAIMKQLIVGLNFLHKQIKVYHGDLKPDNILLQGKNLRDEFIIKEYLSHKYYKILKDDPHKYHNMIIDEILEKAVEYDIYDCDLKYLDNPKISIADFGNFCDFDDQYDEVVGTRYYMAPEVMLLGDCTHKVDYWALGCTCYELITGKVLFNPRRKEYDTNHEHLCEIISLCGKIPKKVIKKSRLGKKYFLKKTYKLRNFTKKEVKYIKNDLDSFILRLIDSDPRKRMMYL